jgi:dolichyl-diphosphooligosaccharide--protein glycosyltransferase
VISAWWDYGYWIETVANRTTIADGSTLNAQQIIALANMMIKPSNESLSIMKKYDVQYVVVFVTFNPNAPIVGRVATPSEEQSYPFGDNAKWIQMALIASYNQTQFYNFNQSTGSYSYTKLYTNSTIARMMYQTFDIKHFQLVYKSKLGWVLIYKITY